MQLKYLSSIALELLKSSISKAGYSDKVVIGMDVAASEFYRDGKYDLDFKSPDDPSRYITSDELAELYKSFVQDYPGTYCPWSAKLFELRVVLYFLVIYGLQNFIYYTLLTLIAAMYLVILPVAH